MYGENIKKYRTELKLTQKDLADKLSVTAQAVSRWENEEVEPSIQTLKEMAKIFNVSLNELLGIEDSRPIPEPIVEKEIVYKEVKPVLGVCEECNSPIYDSQDLVRNESHHRGGSTTHILCKKCNSERLKRWHEEYVSDEKKKRIRSFIWPTLATALVLAIGLFFTFSSEGNDILTGVLVSLILAICTFTVLACVLLDNNFIGELISSIAGFGFVRFPGLIFSLDLDGIIWLLTVKLIFWIIGFVLAGLALALALIIGGFLSLFVYPFAIIKNIKESK